MSETKTSPWPEPIVWEYNTDRLSPHDDSKIRHKWILSTLPEFFKVCPNPRTCTIDELGHAHIIKYYHSLTGPSVKQLYPEEHESYWINGERLSKEKWEAEVAKLEFNARLGTICE